MTREFDLDAPVGNPDKLYREWMVAKYYANHYGEDEEDAMQMQLELE